MKITTDFAPPLRLISPYFVSGALFLVACTLSLFFISPADGLGSFGTIGSLHLFLVGFVIISIFGAMGQLIPVLLETGHAFVDFYYPILYLCIASVISLALGFWFWLWLLPIGGVLMLSAVSLYLADFFATLKKSERSSVSVTILKFAHIFLFLGIIFGIALSLGLNSLFELNLTATLKLHAFFTVGGFVFLLIIAVAIILLPMFGLSHGFSEKASKISLYLIVAAAFFVVLGFMAEVFLPFAYIFGVFAVFGFLAQVWQIYKKRMRKERDIWFYSLFFSFGSLALSLVLATLGALLLDERLYFCASFLFGYGFLGMLIIGHLYKIVPFLVWFERFSPLVGKQKVPMLHQMVPNKAAYMQFFFNGFGILLSLCGAYLQNGSFWMSGVSMLFIGGIFAFISIFSMLNYK